MIHAERCRSGRGALGVRAGILAFVTALSDEQKQRVREEEIERLRVRNELTQQTQRQSAYKMFIFWVVLIAAAVLLWAVVRSPYAH